jgi:hypothetical protein
VDRAISPDDGYFDRVLKCVPVEVTSVYVLLVSAAGTAFSGTALRWWTFVLFVCGLVAVPAYAYLVLGIHDPAQLAMTTVAFLVVVAISGGWFATFSWWSGYYALLITVIFGVTIALLPFGSPRLRPVRRRPVPPPAAEPAAEPGAEPGAEPAAEAATGTDEPVRVGESTLRDDDSAVLRIWRGVDPPGSVRP